MVRFDAHIAHWGPPLSPGRGLEFSAGAKGKSLLVDIEEQYLGPSLGQRVGPGHEQAILGATLEVKAGTAGSPTDRDVCNCGVVVGVDLRSGQIRDSGAAALPHIGRYSVVRRPGERRHPSAGPVCGVW